MQGKIKILGLLCLLILTACSPKEDAKINVSAAASLKDVMGEIIEEYKKDHGSVEIAVNYGSSGALQKQIEEGADVDIFLSAGKKQVKDLVDKGLVKEDKNIDLLKNDLVLIVQEASQLRLNSFEDLKTSDIKLLAIGDPAGVPAGQYAKEALENLGCYESYKGRLNLASDVRQVLDWVSQGQVDAGIVYKTDAIIEKKVKLIGSAPEGSHKPVIYPLARTSAKEDKAIEEFFSYLQGEKAAEIYEKYGFERVK